MLELRKNMILFSAIFIVSYFSLVYLLLKMPVYAEVTSLIRRMLAKNVVNRVYGYGSIMVDVKSLGRKYTKANEVLMTFSQKSELKVVQNRSLLKQFCFRLFVNGSEPSEYLNTNHRGIIKESYISEAGPNEKRYTDVRCNCYLTIDSLPGRSGNQMFQVAALLGTAYNHDLIPVIPSDFPLSKWFDLPNVMDLNLKNAETFTVRTSGIYLPDIEYLNGDKNWTIRGYFQSWKYFRNAQDVVKRTFKIKERYLNNPTSFVRNISEKGRSNVCVHVRRGDLSDSVAIRKGYSIAGLDFIYKAMEFYRKEFKAVQFIVLSDGMIWCQENIKGRDVIFSPFNWPAEDMALMTLCDHVIVTSGTFGWWGAWLSGGVTVYYKGYPKQGSWLASQIDRSDYYPSAWMAL